MFTRSTQGGRAAPLFQSSLFVAVVGFGLYFDHASQLAQEPAALAESVQTALKSNEASDQVRSFAQWVMLTQDHAGLPFIVVDKAQARLYAFGPHGQLRASAPVLLGAAKADEPGPPATPAGRFTNDAVGPRAADGIAWTHQGVQLSLHALPATQASGEDLQRLASVHLDDRRVSEGSLHVAAGFYREHLDPLRAESSVAYVLPETVPVDAVFKPYAMQHDTRIAQTSTRSHS